ncbi:L-arginine-specific L-amino acid ligase [Streptomyces xanthophaeus]|uniref:ATP-grasp domain-containing protein n=1 Tax=Streptomyces xanthophaeus TaxID=67385 RepID=UPI00233EAFB5|nr:ATP-grasp domain-containing protein [Streptomyces xanthophaeus]WCD86470.1 L-arginine-specific L-amino acid ligase [Streptomyces xanthophaeus]
MSDDLHAQPAPDPELLLIGVGLMGRPYVRAAHRLGLRVRAVEAETRAEEARGLVDELELSQGRYGSLDELWAESAYEAALRRRPDGVLAFTESHVLAATLVQDRLALPGPSLQAAAISRNKALQRGRFRAHGIGQPEYRLTGSLTEAGPWAEARLPVVVKPLSSAGSEGVELVPGADAYREAAVRRGGEGLLLVETAAQGPEYSWEALVQGGKVWFANLTAKETTGPPHFVEVSHRVAVQLPPEEAAVVDALGESVIEAIGMRTGLVHLEFRLTATGPQVMEVAVRTPGDYLMDLCSLAYGIDWFEMVVRLAVGAQLPPAPQAPVRYAASHFVVSEPGTVVAVEGLEQVRAHPAVVDCGVSVAVGDRIAATSSSGQRTAFAVLAAPSREALEEALAQVRSTLLVTTEVHAQTSRGRDAPE